ncbi:uncharacterized protein LOC143358869 [Halictus rubicundus]|uniref:uncharacterized protein LOC143358869 n=1 Tax=Halictus rubicundus TaxID=77578 RepID=UPI004036932E
MKMEDFVKMEQLALKYQQFYYELLPDWFLYTSKDYDYIQQRIGFALYGAPECDQDERLSAVQSTNLSTNWKYDKQARKTISNIYSKILECSTQNNNSFSSAVYMGIIYNIVFNQAESKKSSNDIYALPIFKIKVDHTTIWYIDNTGRVYKSWPDYVQNNTLPKCFMIIPKDGVYQCNPHYTVTKRSSTVWTHTVQSPACASAKNVLNVIDHASNVMSITAAAGLGIVSLFTPLAPIALGASLISCGVTGAWSIGRNIEKLVDRIEHKQSLNPSEGDALSAWLGITSSALSIGMSGGSMLLSKAIARGSTISNAAKIAFNSVAISNLTVNGCGIVCQGYRLIYQYRTHKKVDIFDMVMLSSQVLFFSNSLINMKLANELIGTSNGTVLERFKNILRFERLEQQYNKIMGRQSNSEGIIHRLTRVSNAKAFLANHNLTLTFTNGVITLNGITLIDPFLVVERLLTFGVIAITKSGVGSLLNKKIVTKLKNLFLQLLKDFISVQPSTSNKQSDDFNRLLGMFNEMAYMNNCTDLFKMIFQISTRVLLGEQDSARLLQDAILFVWEYSKENVRKSAVDACSPLKGNSALYNLLTKMITNVSDFIDQLANDMYSAFYLYMSSRNDIQCLN